MFEIVHLGTLIGNPFGKFKKGVAVYQIVYKLFV